MSSLNTKLITPRDCVPKIASLFNKLNNSARIRVCEDVCFGTDKWLDLGEITLKPGTEPTSELQVSLSEIAVKNGFYEWKTSSYKDLAKDLQSLIDSNSASNSDKQKIEDFTNSNLQSVIDISRRMLLLLPHLDADVFAKLPFRRPTTVIADTSTISQGGIDFLIRFLCPMARLKIPAIVAMEIHNQTDRFLSIRRKLEKSSDKERNVKKLKLLHEHNVSQANQRALLRFELHSDIEIERTALFSDPLRNAFKAKDPDFPELNISAPVRSYCDRLILESARQHLTTVSPGHPVLLMTSDEGLARMALSEGIEPFFFHAARPKELYGQILTGVRFEPFTGSVYTVPLQNLLWELAVTFGKARLTNKDGSTHLEITAFAKDLNWQPFHAKDDLLRVTWTEDIGETPQPLRSHAIQDQANKSTEVKDLAVEKTNISEPKPASKAQIPAVKSTPKNIVRKLNPNTVYQFSVNVFFKLIDEILSFGKVSNQLRGTILAKHAKRNQRHYLGFLRSGGFVKDIFDQIESTESLENLYTSLKTHDRVTFTELFYQVPSFKRFLNELEIDKISKNSEDADRLKPSPTYIQIAEICGKALKIPEDGVYGTFYSPKLRDFTETAFRVYESLRKGEDYVSTGEWLENMATTASIHPLLAREKLNEAVVDGKLERSTQGSSPDTRFKGHTMAVLTVKDGLPQVDSINLYHGDFLIPGKASVSLKLVRK